MSALMPGDCILIRTDALESFLAWLAGQKQIACSRQGESIEKDDMSNALYYSGWREAPGSVQTRLAILFPDGHFDHKKEVE